MWNYRLNKPAVKKDAAEQTSVFKLNGNTALSSYMEGMQQLYRLPQQVTNQWVEMVSKVNSEPSNQDPGVEAKKKNDEKVKLSSPFVGGVSTQEMMNIFSRVSGRVICKPNAVIEETNKLAKELTAAVANPEALEKDKKDRRFRDDAWDRSPMHKMAMHGYLAWSRAVNNMIDQAELEEKDAQRARYLSSLVTDALAPSNSLLGNPVALEKLRETGGQSLLEGFQNFSRDLAENNGMPSQVDKTAFEVGDNLAATPGQVVYQNEVLELIQYTPSTPLVHERPIMFIPPVVNKYYLLDLAPGKSAVEYLVDNGFQVFMVSWRNPTRENRHWGLDEYVTALEEGVEAIQSITHNEEINLYAACTGAIPMAALLGYLAATGKEYVKSATMVVAVLDSNEKQSLGLFASKEAILKAKMKSRQKGVLDGDEMGKVFTWMRPNDLVWNYWVNNYLMGKKPPAFDILYWNNDSIRVTAKLHEQMLDVFSEDLLAKPGGLVVKGHPIDLKQVTCDIYMVGGETDHISVWKGCFNSAKFFGGDYEFVLHSSGHVQSIINPPGNPKASYKHNSKGGETADDWLSDAERTQGSWWDHWRGWLAERSGEETGAPYKLGSNQHAPLYQAPGTYVMEK
jgi:polyhydroxyalkanoate synthase